MAGNRQQEDKTLKRKCIYYLRKGILYIVIADYVDKKTATFR